MWEMGESLWGIHWTVFSLKPHWQVSKKKFTVKYCFFNRFGGLVYVCSWYFEKWMEDWQLFRERKEAERACLKLNKKKEKK